MNYRFIIVVLSLIFLSIGCTPPKEKPKTLTVTIEPQKYFLEAIVGHHYKVECIVPGGANPESADFTPSQLMNLDKSVAYFKIGYLGIENTLIEKVTKTNDKIKVINCSEGIELVGEPCDQDLTTDTIMDMQVVIHISGVLLLLQKKWLKICTGLF